MYLKPLKIWVQAVAPIVYDDSLSYYETLSKVTQKTNEVIEQVNENTEGIEALNKIIEKLGDVDELRALIEQVETIVEDLYTDETPVMDSPNGWSGVEDHAARSDHSHPSDDSKLDVGMGITDASVGKFVKVKTVDNGVPTEYETGDGSGVPSGGTTGQALKKNSNTNYDAGWQDVHEIPTGGNSGYILAKNSNQNYNAGWRSIASLEKLKDKKCLLIGDSYNNGNGGVSGKGWGYYFQLYTECVATIVHQNGGGFVGGGNTGTSTYPNKNYAECVPLITGDFEYIIAQAGWNDASENINPGGIPAIETGVTNFITAARNKWPNAKIVIIATNNGTDTTFVKANKLRAIAETALKNNVVSSIYSAYWLNSKGVAATDGIHLNDDGYQLLAHLMANYVNGWDGVYYKANHYNVDASDIITQENVSVPGTVNCYFDNNSCTLSFDVTLTETLNSWAQIMQNVPAPSAALITTISNWDASFRPNIRANVGSTGNVSVRYGAAGNYRVFITYQLK